MDAAHVGIMRLQAAYADVVTRRAWDELPLLFAEGCTVTLDLRDGSPRVLRGGEELTAFVAGALERFPFFVFAVLNVVTWSGGSRTYIHEIRRDREGAPSDAYGVYEDRVEPAPGGDGWRFAERRYTSLSRGVIPPSS